jgi:hemerythrin
VWHGSISVGVAVRTRDMVRPEQLLKVADEGVYKAKHQGRNAVATVQVQHG